MKGLTTKKLFAQIISACGGLGWSISFNAKAKTIKYLIIGQQKEVDRILKKLENK